MDLCYWLAGQYRRPLGLLGFSMGASWGFRLAPKYPQLFRSMVFVAGYPSPSSTPAIQAAEAEALAKCTGKSLWVHSTSDQLCPWQLEAHAWSTVCSGHARQGRQKHSLIGSFSLASCNALTHSKPRCYEPLWATLATNRKLTMMILDQGDTHATLQSKFVQGNVTQPGDVQLRTP